MNAVVIVNLSSQYIMERKNKLQASLERFKSKKFDQLLLEEFEFYRTINIAESIDNAVFGRYLKKDGLQYYSSHYKHFLSVKNGKWNVQDLLYPARDKLRSVKEEIAAVDNFLDMHKIIEQVINIKGLGKLFYYDVALRIGNSKAFGPNYILPEEVFIQRGAEQGAKALFGNDYINQVLNERSYLRMQEFEEIDYRFKEMPPYLIECFLCIEKDNL